jgi:hypothetical protein
MPVELTKRYLRVRVREPSSFAYGSIRTNDTGRPGHDKRLAGILKKSGKWATQAWLIDRAGLRKKDPKTVALLRKVSKNLSDRRKLELRRALRKV